jgi:hypothetical protein
MDGKFLYNWIREQLSGQVSDALLGDRLADVDDEPLPLAHTCYLDEAETTAGAGDRVALGIMNLRLEHDVDDEAGHVPNSTRACGPARGRAAGPRGRSLALEHHDRV